MTIHLRNEEGKEMCQGAYDAAVTFGWFSSPQLRCVGHLAIRTMPLIESSPTVSPSNPLPTTDVKEEKTVLRITKDDLEGIKLRGREIDWMAMDDYFTGDVS